MHKNYYEILNLEPHANENEIKQAYRDLAKKYHPDINHSPKAHEKFIEISEAYEFLLEKITISPVKEVIIDRDDIFNREYFEEMRRLAKERAQEHAKKRFEKLKREQEAFQESGLYDLILLTNYLCRYALLLICLVLVISAIVLSLDSTNTKYIIRLIMLSLGSLGIYFIGKNWRTYFQAGKFYYNFNKIKKTLSFKSKVIAGKCFYSPHYKADSRPYHINMVKLKDIQLHNYGPGQHSVAFNQKSINIEIPRSQHALMVHASIILMKLFLFISAVAFLNISSIIWRIIIGILAGYLTTKIVLIITRTKATATYLLTPALIIRGSVWLLIIIANSKFQIHPFDIYTSEYIFGITVFIFLFDTFLDQFLNFISRKRCGIPIFKQHPLIESYLEKKYQFVNDMPILSVFYPLFKWFLG